MGIVVEGIALRPPGLGAEVGRQLLVASLAGAVVRLFGGRLFGGRLFGLALTAVGGLLRRVVGIGIVVVLHKLHYRDSQLRNPPTPDLTPIHDRDNAI